MTRVVYDIETLRNCFTLCALDLGTREFHEFVIHKSRDDREQMLQWLSTVTEMVGFNNLAFDWPVVDYIMRKKPCSVAQMVRGIYEFANKTIENERSVLCKPKIRQVDLFRIWHFNNKSRYTSLKWLQINMGWPNVMEMPIPHSTAITADQIPIVLEYNKNDVLSTEEFLKRSEGRIALRKTLSEKYDKDMTNHPDTKIGETIFVRGLMKRSGLDEKTIMSRRTPRYSIALGDCLIPGLGFKTEPFTQAFNRLTSMVITSTRKGDMEPITCILDGVQYEFGFGGLHAFRSPGIYKDVVTADVSSYYPNLSISHNLFPAHIGPVFCDVYRDLYEERKQYPKGTEENLAIKLALNGTFGASNAEWSPFYDPRFTMQITLNGQILLAMLCEAITIMKAGHVIMANTDGLEVDVTDPDMFKRITDRWQERFKLQLEFDKYAMLVAPNVNSYLAITTSGKVKEKNAFETEKEIHKDQSMRIVPIAVRAYFEKGIPVEQTIEECKEIGPFLMGVRARTGRLSYRTTVGGKYEELPLGKTVRYYLSNSGGSIMKIYHTEKKVKQKDISVNQMSLFGATDTVTTIVDKPVSAHVGRKMTLFQRWVDIPFEKYDVDKSFYIRECYKLIEEVKSNQL